jgi:hypothetical protein
VEGAVDTDEQASLDRREGRISSRWGYFFNGGVDLAIVCFVQVNIRTAACPLGLPFSLIRKDFINQQKLSTNNTSNFKQNQSITMSGSVRMAKDIPTEQWAQVVEKTGQR